MNELTVTNTRINTRALELANLAPGTRRHYMTAIYLLIGSSINPFELEQMAEYANSLPASGRSNLKAALRIIGQYEANKAKSSNAPVEVIQRYLWLLDVMNDAIKTTQPETERNPHWLSKQQVDTILDNSQGRDHIVMSVLFGAGLRREELETLDFDALSQIPHKGTMKDVLTVIGKGDKKRVIPISAQLAAKLRDWQLQCKGGRVARRVSKSGKIGKSLSAYGIFTIVRRFGNMIGIPNLDPHDCRRTYGRIMYETKNDIVLVQNLLGHANPRTTLRYIGYHINLDITDFPDM